VPRETADARNARLAKAQAYTQAVEQIKTLWRDSYLSGHNKAVQRMTQTTGLISRDWQRRSALWKELAQNPPKATCDVNTLQTREQCNAAMTLYLYDLGKDARLDVWTSMFTADIFATFFFQSRHVVDLR
jgi:hypothetical protein